MEQLLLYPVPRAVIYVGKLSPTGFCAAWR